MSRNVKVLSALSNVSAGSTATLELPLGHTYDQITFEYSGVTPEQIKNIKLNINGKAVQSYKSAVRLNQLNAYWKRPVTAGFLDMHFVRPEMTNLEYRRLYALGTADVATVDITFDIDAAAVNPVIQAQAVLSPNTPLGLITKVKEFPVSSATAGEKEIDNLPKRARVGAIHLMGKSDINKIEVEVDSYKVYEATKVRGEKLQSDANRTPLGADGTSIDFIREGNPFNALVLRSGKVSVQDFRIRPTLGTAGAFDAVVEYFDEYAGI